MATFVPYFEEVELQFSDGNSATVTLDRKTIQKLQAGDNALMESIRKNLVNSKVIVPSRNFDGPSTSTSTVSEATEPSSSQSTSSVEEPVVAEAMDCQPVSDNSDVEDTEKSHMNWTKEAVLYLIALYQEHETELEDPKKRKKDIWKIITEKMISKGYSYSQNKVESRWRSLIRSHKEARNNNNTSGRKRKTFDFFGEIEEIVSKRHDIYPVYLSGSNNGQNAQKKYSTRCESPLTSPERRRQKREQEDTEFLSLPLEVLSCIIELLEQSDRNNVRCVCKCLRALVYTEETDFYARVDVLSSKFEPLSSMPNLQRLEINGTFCSGEIVVNCFKSVKFTRLATLTLRNFRFTNKTFMFMAKALHHVKHLNELECIECGKVSVEVLRYILDQIPGLKCCIVDVNLEGCGDSVRKFAEVANALAGKVNLSLNSLSLVPPSLLVFP